MRRASTAILPPEIHLILRNAIFAFEISLAAAGVFLLFTILFVKREATIHLQRLVLVLTALFFIPATLKAFAFQALWGQLEIHGAPPKLLFFLWTMSFNTVFFWVALLAFVNSQSARSTIDALYEVTLPRERYVWLARLILPPTVVAWACCFAFTLFAGLELRLLVPTLQPIGDIISTLFGGSDVNAAKMSLVAMAIGVSLTLFVCALAKRAWHLT
jgi:hypothetical protein